MLDKILAKPTTTRSSSTFLKKASKTRSSVVRADTRCRTGFDNNQTGADLNLNSYPYIERRSGKNRRKSSLASHNSKKGRKGSASYSTRQNFGRRKSDRRFPVIDIDA